MKKERLLIFASVIFFNLHLTAQTCPMNSTMTIANFETQQQIDQFPLLYPNCMEIQRINVHGNNITNLQGLSGLVSIGNLRIESNPLLTSLEGLNNLTALENLIVYDNPLLVNLQGLGNFPSLHNLAVVSNPGLQNLTGLEDVAMITEYLMLSDNGALTALDGLNGLTRTGIFSITENPVLADISALSALKNVEYDFVFEDAAVENLHGLENLVKVGKTLYLQRNPNLSDISSLNHPVVIQGQLYIQHNHELGDCAVQAVCDYLTTRENTEYHVYGNNGNCFTHIPVQTACLAVPTHEVALKFVRLVPNPAVDVFTVTGVEGQIDGIQVAGATGQVLLKQQAPDTQSVDVSNLPAGLYFITLQVGKQTVVKKLVKI